MWRQVHRIAFKFWKCPEKPRTKKMVGGVKIAATGATHWQDRVARPTESMAWEPDWASLSDPPTYGLNKSRSWRKKGSFLPEIDEQGLQGQRTEMNGNKNTLAPPGSDNHRCFFA
ncbi:hypothetical protein BDN72DRAFT_858352 [Pluteus cervinus]|uniref:Uncharacterized protein n=1 Tax=Pluteus cervinus TaxID=181527 RepID=A0ACD3ARJ8_9AGAR|nr:hypothetical protein BDN72DRAFT_858352 [Pluteus cervinus]